MTRSTGRDDEGKLVIFFWKALSKGQIVMRQAALS